ncbi:MAG: metal ABC transporter permease [Cytophagales bacterium]|nr:metal ABC transporter permease [Cytophagales bacterium]
MTVSALYIILTGILIAISAALLGSLLLARRMSMMGDAISHAVLPGIVLAFLLFETREPWVMLLAAMGTGLATTFIIQFLQKTIGIRSDAALGITFTTFFATGIILISLFASKVDVDQDCVLFGEIAYVPLDLWISSSGLILGPRALYINLFTMLCVLGTVLLFYRQWELTTFDPHFAKSIGINSSFWNYLLMGLTSCVMVSAFESVGAILGVAFLVIPPAIGYLCARRLSGMLVIACISGSLMAILGYEVAYIWNGSISGAMASVGGIFLLLIIACQKISSRFRWRFSLGKTPL